MALGLGVIDDTTQYRPTASAIPGRVFVKLFGPALVPDGMTLPPAGYSRSHPMTGHRADASPISTLRLSGRRNDAHLGARGSVVRHHRHAGHTTTDARLHRGPDSRDGLMRIET